MGDYFQSVISPSISEADASARATAVLEWLVSEEIVLADETDCVLGGSGHQPGHQHQKATGSVGVDRGLITNGLEVSTERRVFHAGQGGFALICADCGAEFDENIESWSDAINEWFGAEGPGDLKCPTCDAIRPITQWTFDPVWAFGYLGFTFWNWPKLTDTFLREFERRVGAPVVLVMGKL